VNTILTYLRKSVCKKLGQLLNINFLSVMATKKRFNLKAKHKNPKGGLNAAGRRAYNRATGSNLKAPQPQGGKRRDSFCARMKGMKKKLTSAKTARDPNSRINKALRIWNCSLRTKKGSVTAEARAKHGTIGDRYPIFDKRSAISAVKLRGHGNLSAAERAKVLRRAAQYAPAVVAKARLVDKKYGVSMVAKPKKYSMARKK
jgi:hypothetical protein